MHKQVYSVGEYQHQLTQPQTANPMSNIESTNRPPLPARIKARRTIAAAAYDSGNDNQSPMKDTNGFLIIPGFGAYIPQGGQQPDPHVTMRSTQHTASFNVNNSSSTLPVPSAEDFYESSTVQMEQFERKVSRSAATQAAQSNKYPRVELNKLRSQQVTQDGGVKYVKKVAATTNQPFSTKNL